MSADRFKHGEPDCKCLCTGECINSDKKKPKNTHTFRCPYCSFKATDLDTLFLHQLATGHLGFLRKITT